MAIIALYPNIVTAGGSLYTFGGTSTSHVDAVDDDYLLPDLTNYIDVITGNNNPSIIFGIGTMAPAIAINTVTVRRTALNGSGSQTVITYVRRPSDSSLDVAISAAETGVAATRTKVYTLNPFTTLPWQPEDFIDLEIQQQTAGSPVTSTTRVYLLHLEIDYVPASSSIGLPLGVASSALRVVRAGIPFVQLKAPASFLNVPLLEPVRLSHYAGPTPDGAGWGEDKPWKRVEMIVIGKVSDMDSHSVELKGLLATDIQTRLWDTLVSEEAPDADQSGPARFSASSKALVRTSGAWIESAAAAAQNDMQLVAVGAAQPKLAAGGTYIEPERENILTRSSFISGTTGLTLAGTGSGGSAIAADTTTLLFESTVTPQSLKFTGGSPIGAADCEATWAATASIASASKLRLTIFKKDASAAAPLAFKLRRSNDSFYWKESDNTWQAGEYWNYMTGSTTWERYVSKVLTLSAFAQTLTLSLGIPGTTYGPDSVAGQINWAGNVTLTVGDRAGTPIVTDAAAFTVNADTFTYTNSKGARGWNRDHGRCLVQVIPEFDGTDVPVGERRIVLDSSYDLTNNDRISYLGGTGWVFSRLRKNVLTSAINTAACVRGTTYKLVARWTGVEGERDLDPYTLDLFVDGVKGASITAAGIHDPLPTHGFIALGSSYALADKHWGGRILRLDINDYVPYDEECR